jgi:hypothetical protein
MNKPDAGIGMGLVAAIALCCGAHLLVLAIAAPTLALATGQSLLIAASIVVALLALGVFLWRRSGRCRTAACPPRETTPAVRSRLETDDLDDTAPVR